MKQRVSNLSAPLKLPFLSNCIDHLIFYENFPCRCMTLYSAKCSFIFVTLSDLTGAFSFTIDFAECSLVHARWFWPKFLPYVNYITLHCPGFVIDMLLRMMVKEICPSKLTISNWEMKDSTPARLVAETQHVNSLWMKVIIHLSSEESMFNTFFPL